MDGKHRPYLLAKGSRKRGGGTRSKEPQQCRRQCQRAVATCCAQVGTETTSWKRLGKWHEEDAHSILGDTESLLEKLRGLIMTDRFPGVLPLPLPIPLLHLLPKRQGEASVCCVVYLKLVGTRTDGELPTGHVKPRPTLCKDETCQTLKQACGPLQRTPGAATAAMAGSRE